MHHNNRDIPPDVLECMTEVRYIYIVSYNIFCNGEEKMETVTARVPEELFRDIVEIERQEKAERAEVIRKLLDRAVREWKLKRSLEMLREGKTTFRTAAKMAGLTYVEMFDEVERAGIPIRYSMAELQADLSELKKRK